MLFTPMSSWALTAITNGSFLSGFDGLALDLPIDGGESL